MNRYFFFLSLFVFSLVAPCQKITKDYFRSPLDIPLYLSGNFGELRSNHFHAGLDIKTQGVEGKKVYAVADGYVSRIKVSPYGYGNALYITHPNGFTSVYGHLQKYAGEIATLVKDYQYKKESFGVQIFPTPFQLQVKKGEIVAYTGNTGGSGGPHLHFEIRNTATEHPFNPLFFGFDIKDARRPDIRAITIYPLNDTSYINGENKEKRISLVGSGDNYRLNLKNTLKVYGEFGLGIETVDRMSETHNTYGLHTIALSHNSDTIYAQQIDEFAFHEGRYINSHIDYETYIRRRRRVEKSFVQEGNHLRIYRKLVNKGKLDLTDGKEHEFSYVVKDLEGNSSTLNFSLVSHEPSVSGREIKERENVAQYFHYDQRNTFIRDNILLDLPKGVLYEDLYFTFEETPQMSNTLSPVYWLHNHYTPLHSYINVSIKVPNISEKYKKKALIVSTIDGRSLYSEGGSWKGDNISVRTRSFGGYTVTVDTIPPRIIPINISINANMSNKWAITIKVMDNLAGIEHFRGTIDGKWILMEYDAKSKLLHYYFDEHVSKGRHTFKLNVTDGVGNSSQYETTFIR